MFDTSDLDKYGDMMADNMFTVDVINEVANAMVIGKLESKLPTLVNKDWSTQVIKDAYTKKSSKETFECFIKFLTTQKKIVEYNLPMLVM